MVTQVIQMFLIPFSAKAFAKGDTAALTTVLEKTICFSAIILLPLFLLFFFLPEQFLHLLYHGKFDAAAPTLRVMAWMSFLVPWASPAASYLLGLGKVRAGFLSSVALMAISLPLYYFLTPILGAQGTALGLIIAFSIVTVGLMLYLHTLVPYRIARIFMRVSDVWVVVRDVAVRIVPDKRAR